jgi:hypothetical protein
LPRRRQCRRQREGGDHGCPDGGGAGAPTRRSYAVRGRSSGRAAIKLLRVFLAEAVQGLRRAGGDLRTNRGLSSCAWLR